MPEQSWVHCYKDNLTIFTAIFDNDTKLYFSYNFTFLQNLIISKPWIWSYSLLIRLSLLIFINKSKIESRTKDKCLIYVIRSTQNIQKFIKHILNVTVKYNNKICNLSVKKIFSYLFAAKLCCWKQFIRTYWFCGPYFYLFYAIAFLFLHMKFSIDRYITQPYWFWGRNSVFGLWRLALAILSPT
jgi:hypothetical protein